MPINTKWYNFICIFETLLDFLKKLKKSLIKEQKIPDKRLRTWIMKDYNKIGKQQENI